MKSKMKLGYLVIVMCSMLLLAQNSFSQGVAINENQADPHASAILDVSSTDKGILVPRMSTAQRTAIGSPAKGLMVFDNDLNQFWFYNGSGWAAVGGGDNIYTANGTLSGDRTVTQSDNDLTFTTGTGKIEINGNFMTSGGALYAKPPRIMSTAGPIIWAADDVTILLISGYSGNIVLPSASANPYRIVGINNRSGAVRGIDNTSGGDTGIYANENFTQLAATVGMVWFISDGTSWRLYSGRP